MRDWVEAFNFNSLVSAIITAMNKFTIQMAPKKSIITKTFEVCIRHSNIFHIPYLKE